MLPNKYYRERSTSRRRTREIGARRHDDSDTTIILCYKTRILVHPETGKKVKFRVPVYESMPDALLRLNGC